MQWTRAAAAIGAVLAMLVLAQGGCETQLNQPSEPVVGDTETAAPQVTPEAADEVQPDQADQTLTDASTRPTAEPALSVGPSTAAGGNAGAAASPSAVPKPSRVAASQSPTAEPPAEMVVVSMAKDNRVAEVDPATGRMIRVVDLSQAAGKMAMTPDGHSAWVFKSPAPGSTVAVLETTSGDRREDLKFHEGDVPVAATFSTDGSRAYVATAGVVVFASASGKEFGRISVGHQTPGVQIGRRVTSLAVSPGANGDVLYAADQASGVVWVLDAGSGALLNEIEVGGGPTSLVPDPARQRLYVLVDTSNQIVALDTSTGAILNRLNLPAAPIAAALKPDGTLYVTGGDPAGEVWVVKSDAAEISARVPIGGRPVGIALSADSRSLFIPDSAGNTLNIISADTIQVIRSLTLAGEPVAVVVSHPQGAASALAVADTTPTPTPTLVPSPTALPEGALPPDALPAGAIAEPFVSGADVPAALAFSPDGRLFYNELRTGRIRVVQDGVLLPDAFYQFLVSDQPNAGLLGLTLDPDFQHNHYLYVLYTAPKTGGSGGGATGPNEVVRLTDVDNKGTDLKHVLQDLPSVGGQNAAALRFGPDGELYVSLADDDKGPNAQDLGSLAGKILRVNPDGSSPPDNPFAGQPDKQDAIWAYGLHDAYSVAFHPLGSQLLAAEAGVDRDTLDVIVRGGNYGFPTVAGIDPIAAIKPVIRPTGSTFYVGDQLPAWKNDWFYCDAVQRQLRRVRLAAQTFDRVVFEEIVKQGCSLDVATGPDGALYYSDAQGIYRIRMPGADALPALRASAEPPPGAATPAAP